MSLGRKNIMIGTAGHVDHGKSALVKLLTGCETDTLAEEKERGLTIDLGFAPCRLAGDRVVGIVDVPGHIDFIRNMVAGAHGIDIVLFVVAADDGIMPQTYEHLHILTLMGLRHGLVALTKIDLVEPSRREQVIEDLRSLLAGTFLEQAPICPISNITGEGFDDFFDALNLAVESCGARSSSGIFRMWVEDVFKIKGAGTVVTGIPSSGLVRVGDELAMLPAGALGHVRRMQVYGEDATEARAGECVALNLPELNHQAIRRGMVLGVPNTSAAVTMAEGELQILPAMKGTIPDYIEVSLHVGTAAVSARVAMLEKTEMAAGEKQMVQLRWEEPLALIPSERFVLRANIPGSGQSGLTTIGGGRILSTSNVRLRRKKQWTLDMLAGRREAIGDLMRWCEQIASEAFQPVTLEGLQKDCFLNAGEMKTILEKLRAQGRVVLSDSGAVVHRKRLDQIAAKVVTTLEGSHAANPQSAGLGRGDLLALVEGNTELLNLALQTLLGSKQLQQNGTVFALAGWRAQVADPDQRLLEQIASAFQKAGWTSPLASELSISLREPAEKIEKMIRLLVERGILARLDDRIYMHREAIEAAKEVALRLFKGRTLFSTMEFRDALGVSRKYAVPVLDHLDKLRVTVRNGNNRMPGVEARKVLTAK